MRGTIQWRVDNELASMIVSGSLDPGERVEIPVKQRHAG